MAPNMFRHFKYVYNFWAIFAIILIILFLICFQNGCYWMYITV